MCATEKMTKGVKFQGDKGWIEVSRGHYVASDDSLLPPKKNDAESDVPYESKGSHHQNFIDAVRNRVDPIVPVEIGHSSCTLCTLGNIACELGQPIQWNPATETFVNDPDGAAAALLHYDYREPYSL